MGSFTASLKYTLTEERTKQLYYSLKQHHTTGVNFLKEQGLLTRKEYLKEILVIFKYLDYLNFENISKFIHPV